MESWLSFVINQIDLKKEAEENNPFIGKFTSIEIDKEYLTILKKLLKEEGIAYCYKVFKQGDKYVII